MDATKNLGSTLGSRDASYRDNSRLKVPGRAWCGRRPKVPPTALIMPGSRVRVPPLLLVSLDFMVSYGCVVDLPPEWRRFWQVPWQY